ncbi:MAG: hypothetical protein NDI63_02235 [Pseudobdellovibrio sp.]|nr:hypothetical protein [Pseudobdellovibrio sp.]
MKQVLLALAFVAPMTASADIIKCTFTEPFVSSTYSMTQSTLTYESIDGQKTVIQKVSMQIKAAGIFELVAKDGKVLQRLDLNNQGSNGMSDHVYPYDVQDNTSMTNNGRGGCESNYLKKTGE